MPSCLLLVLYLLLIALGTSTGTVPSTALPSLDPPPSDLEALRCYTVLPYVTFISKGKAIPLQAQKGPEGSRKLRFPDFVTTAQDVGRLPALRTGRLYPQEMLLVLISVGG